MQIIINKTPHDVNIVKKTGENVRTYPASGGQIRLKMQIEQAGNLQDTTPLTKTVFGEPEGLPPFDEGTYYIVSQLVKNALPRRKDLLVPCEIVRDEKGNIIGCESLGI